MKKRAAFLLLLFIALPSFAERRVLTASSGNSSVKIITDAPVGAIGADTAKVSARIFERNRMNMDNCISVVVYEYFTIRYGELIAVIVSLWYFSNHFLVQEMKGTGDFKEMTYDRTFYDFNTARRVFDTLASEAGIELGL